MGAIVGAYKEAKSQIKTKNVIMGTPNDHTFSETKPDALKEAFAFYSGCLGSICSVNTFYLYEMQTISKH